MSKEKNKKEALRWYRTGLEDLQAAKVLAQEHLFARACFHYHQAAEKFLKAVWYHEGHEPWGHSLVKLAEELPNPAARNIFETLADFARDLDKYYIPTRYPNGIPDETPEKFYSRTDSTRAKEAAEKLRAATESLLEIQG